MNVERRYRFVWKPLVFVACAVPFVLLLLGAFGIAGQDLGPDPIAKMLHTCGKTALNLLLITLLVTPVRQIAGLPHLLRLRRMLGLFAFFYVALHFAIYIGLDQGFDFAGLGRDIAKRPYITLGFLGLLLLVPLAVTSTNRMMRRLGHRWQSLHRLVYVVAVLGVWHFWWQVKKDIREPLLYVGMLAVLLGWRAFRAAARSRARSAAQARGAPDSA